LPLLASLKERFTYGKLNYFFGVVNNKLDALEGNNFVSKITEDVLALFWVSVVLPIKEVLSCFQE